MGHSIENRSLLNFSSSILIKLGVLIVSLEKLIHDLFQFFYRVVWKIFGFKKWRQNSQNWNEGKSYIT
jgi:hypothetical protein